MYLEYNTLHDKTNAWGIIPRTEDMHVLAFTWVFKCKRFPNGLVRKLKARFCVRGDLHIKRVDFFETYAPVIQWINYTFTSNIVYSPQSFFNAGGLHFCFVTRFYRLRRLCRNASRIQTIWTSLKTQTFAVWTQTKSTEFLLTFEN